MRIACVNEYVYICLRLERESVNDYTTCDEISKAKE